MDLATPLETNSQLLIDVPPCIYDFYLDKFCPLKKYEKTYETNFVKRKKIKVKIT